MDESISSDYFADSNEVSPNSLVNQEEVQYETLVFNTKSSLSSNTEVQLDNLGISKLLEDGENCIIQSLDLVIALLKQKYNIALVDLFEYIDNAVCILQMLSDFFKKAMVSLSLSCCTMEAFPTRTGRIIMTVFSHCKNSESVYGEHLTSVETQLKDLFKSCHNLQVTYLMILGKHFVFDITLEKDQAVLIEALDVNLSIGELVQTLDVKTMAEQWKAYTVMCEKYSSFLVDKDVYCKTSEKLCQMVHNNIDTAAEVNQDEKVILRSMKVASFMIKILNKIYDVLSNSSLNNHEYIVEMLLYIHRHNRAYPELSGDKQSSFIQLLEDNVFTPSESLLKALLSDEKFALRLLMYDIDKIKHDERMLGFVLFVISVMKIAIQMSNVAPLLRNQIISCIFNFLPHCHVWFNIGLKFQHKSIQSVEPATMGLYEHLLTHTVALAFTMDCKECYALEKILIGGILHSDIYIALFSSNLTVCLARVTPALSLNQVITLLRIYKELEQSDLFLHSPQHVHLKHVISKTFRLLEPNDKIKIYDKYSMDKEENLSLWTALKISNLPPKIIHRANSLAAKKFIEYFKNNDPDSYLENDFENMIKSMRLLATCSDLTSTCNVEEYVMKAWRGACLEGKVKIAELSPSTLWYYEYIDALVLLTESVEGVFQKSSNVITILHVISNIAQSANKELKLVIINILFKLAAREIVDKRHEVDIIYTKTFKHFLQDSDVIVKSSFFHTLRKYKKEIRIYKMISKIVIENNIFEDEWQCFLKIGCFKYNMVMKKHLEMTKDFKYRHKCLKSEEQVVDIGQSTGKSSVNFDLVDMDNLFDDDSDSEPVCKKSKLTDETDATDALISTLESAVNSLEKHDIVMSSEYKLRIRNVSDKLRNVLNKC